MVRQTLTSQAQLLTHSQRNVPEKRRRTAFAWLTRYNTRRHSTNGHLRPDEYEHRHHTAQFTLAA
jgi:hypothetical protein